MSLRPEPVGEIPAETARVARAAFPKGTLVTRLRDEFDALYEDTDFRSLYPARGQPGLTPWRLALVTVFQFLEHLIPSPGDQNLWAQSRSPMDMISQGRSVSLFHASQQWSRMSP